MTNPFEDPEAQYVVLVNDENQHSLWPVSIPVPDGWTIAHGESSREDCLKFIEANWTDMRPRSLVEAMDGGEGSAAS
ncbi:MbtH family protein [Streptomyces sp. URMC 129]|uniref:MbtH family protein n=1 Tax=Streptomyces sp. URMC 129 TaxID=3423407 RepID=UPI003F1DBD6C